MKKLLLALLIVLTFGGCIMDSTYIDATKRVQFEYGKSYEDIAIILLESLEFEGRFGPIIEFKTEYGISFVGSNGAVYSIHSGKEELGQRMIYNGLTPIVVSPKEVSWVVEGKTSKGRMVAASTKYGKVVIESIQDGDYVSFNIDDVKAYTNTGKELSLDYLSVNYVYNECVILADKVNRDNGVY